MAVLETCLNFAVVSIVVTSLWVFLGRNLSFGTLSLAMYFPTLIAFLYVAASGKVVQFVVKTLGIRSLQGVEHVPFSEFETRVQNFSVITACLISVAVTGTIVTLCALLNVLLGWGHLSRRDGKEDERPLNVKELMSRNEIWGFLRASGEEVGWRCYLLPCLVESFSPAEALAISGVIWGLFHVAIMILLTSRLKVDHQVTTVTVQFAAVFLAAYPHGWIAMRSGYSIWPSAVMHYSWNCLNPYVFGSIYTHKPGLFSGEQWLINGEGLAGCIVFLPLAILIVMDLSQ